MIDKQQNDSSAFEEGQDETYAAHWSEVQFNYFRRQTSLVHVGGTPLGENNPIRIQSMTNRNTMNTKACVEQAKRIVDAGGEYVRLTTQGTQEAESLKEINIGLRTDNYNVPLIADVHFNPNVADIAAKYAEKVRINPGNYVDPVRTFKQMDYTDEEYALEVQKIRDRFVPFLNICKENYTAIRIGVNHGSLSDRIMSRYGDTPEGMVESCMEFLRICVEENFSEVVISIKASNTVVMVRTVRLLVSTMEKEGMYFPLHLGVTEAGEGEDGRIKSALGIGALLFDGIGDTIRVSLSEKPEAEIPVARKLVDHIMAQADHKYIPGVIAEEFDYFSCTRRRTHAVRNIGGDNVPVIVSQRVTNKTLAPSPDFRPDYMYMGDNPCMPATPECQQVLDSNIWKGEKHTWPVYLTRHKEDIEKCKSELKFLFMTYAMLNEEWIAFLKKHPEIVIIAQSDHTSRTREYRAFVHELMVNEVTTPVIFYQYYRENTSEDLQIKAAADMGPLIFDGFCDGLFLMNQGRANILRTEAIAFGILQAGRVRVSKTEYISCPGCGRTLFGLQKAVARVKAATSHLKGLKIAIMGCIVNGPGEMADADYGYVGAGVGKVSLYKRKECIEKNIPEAEAVDKLIELIKANGDYIERE